MATTCSHNTCAILAKAGVENVCSFLFLKYKKDGFNGWVLLTGCEKKDNQYNAFAGQINPGECPLHAVKREILEEAKLDFYDWSDFNDVFRTPKGYRFFIVKKTAIFVGVLPKGVSRSVLNAKINAANANPKLAKSLKELTCVEWVSVETKQKLDGSAIDLNKYVLKYIDTAFNMI